MINLTYIYLNSILLTCSRGDEEPVLAPGVPGDGGRGMGGIRVHSRTRPGVPDIPNLQFMIYIFFKRAHGSTANFHYK